MHNLRPLLFIPAIIVIITLSGCARSGGGLPRPSSVDGVFSMPSGAESSELVGEWAFWPGQFASPGVTPAEYVRFGQFPASWSTYRPDPAPAKGFGSYALTIRGLDPSVLYAFRFPGYSCAARYFVNGEELYSRGLVGESRDAESPAWDCNVVALPSAGLSELTLVLHLSNFHDIFPASPTPILFGPYESLYAAWSYKRILMIIPFGAMLAMGAYFLALFILHREEYSCCWLGILCMVFALRIICYDEFLIQDVFPGLPSWLMFRLGYLTFSLALAAFAGFAYAMYPALVGRWPARVVVSGGLLYGALNLFTPVSLFTAILVPFQAFTLLSAVFLIFQIFRAVVARMEGADLFLAGFVVFFLVIVRDIMIANRVIEGVFLAHYGMFGIIAAMSLIIVRKFSRAFNSLEAASDELARVNASLVRFVPNEFLRYLGKESITDISLGDNVRKDMCVMFLHLGMEIRLDGAEARLNMLEFFNETLRRVNPVIQEFRGLVDKYLNEGIMVLFPDESEMAVLCALRIHGIVREYNVERAGLSLPPIRCAAGIHRGALMLGTIGDAERMDSTVISDVVNTASRLMQFALSRELPIVISADMTQAFGKLDAASCVLVPHGEVHLRGRDQALALFEVRST